MADVAFDFKKFIDETKATILTPAEYFSVMSKTGGFAEPLIKAVIYGFAAALINLLWSALSVGVLVGAFGGMFGAGVGIVGFIWTIITTIIGLFIGGAIVLVISAICGGNTDYEANVRVTASLMVIYPIHSFFGFLSGGLVISTISGIVEIAVSIYGLWLLYNALIKALTCKEGPAKAISIILAAIPVLIIVSGLVCMNVAGTFLNRGMHNQFPEQMMKTNSTEEQDQMKKALEEATKGLEQMNKELQEENKEVQK